MTNLDLEIRFSQPQDDGTIEGLAVKFGVVDNYRTTFDPKAFDGVSNNLPLLWSHDSADVVGSTRSITSTAEGLKIVGKLNLDVQRAREIRAMLIAGDIRGLSIGFRTLQDETKPGGIRNITKAQLREVSFVAFPAVPGSQVQSIRSSDAGAVAFIEACRNAARAMKGK